MTDIFNTAAVQASGISAGHPLAVILSSRDDILIMTEQAYDATLKPDNPGGISHDERAALCCRMARLNGEAALAKHFAGLMSDEDANIADLNFYGDGDARLAAIIGHTDLVTGDTKSVVAGDIDALKSAGISEDDIVRLSELIAFASYQIRLTIGLRLMGEVQ